MVGRDVVKPDFPGVGVRLACRRAADQMQPAVPLKRGRVAPTAVRGAPEHGDFLGDAQC